MKADGLSDYGFRPALAHPEQRKHRAEGHRLADRPYWQVRKFVICPLKVLDKNLATFPSFFPQIVHELLMPSFICTSEVIDVDVAKWSGPHREFMYQGCSHGDFHALNRVHHFQTQLTIKPIALPDSIEVRVWSECAVRLLEGMPIATESVIPNGLKTTYENCVIGNDQPSRFKKFRLIFVRQRGFAEFQRRSDKKRPATFVHVHYRQRPGGCAEQIIGISRSVVNAKPNKITSLRLHSIAKIGQWVGRSGEFASFNLWKCTKFGAFGAVAKLLLSPLYFATENGAPASCISWMRTIRL